MSIHNKRSTVGIGVHFSRPAHVVLRFEIAFIQKPINPASLTTRVREVLRGLSS